MSYVTSTEIERVKVMREWSEYASECIEKLKERGIANFDSSPGWIGRAVKLYESTVIKENAIKDYIERIPALERWDYVEPLGNDKFAVKLRSNAQAEQLEHFAKQGVKVRLK